MISTKIESISITTIREKGVESIVDWFEQHLQTFYTLGLSYLRNQQQMEELFFRSIMKVDKELSRFKNETSFETRVTSIFIDICRELSNDGSLQVSEADVARGDLFKELDELNKYEKEALVLTYIKGISKEETAGLLRVSVEELKEHLFSGIQSLKKGMGYGACLNGCQQYYKHYIDYFDRTMERPQKVDFEAHIFHCQNCQEDFAAFQDVMLTLLNFTKKMGNFHVPFDFMKNVKAKLAEKENHRQRKSKKRKRIGYVLASVIAILMGVGVFTGAFANLYYTWTEKDKDLRTFLQHGLGKRLNLVAESNGVKIKIKSVIADDVQTLIFYEIESTSEANQYAVNYEGATVENVDEMMNTENFPKYYLPDLKSNVNNKEKNVFHGKLSLLPLTKDKGIIKLKITRLMKLIRDPSNGNRFNPYAEADFKSGDWNFEIPVTKHPSIEYALDKETKIEGIPVRFNKLTIAPTATILEISFNNLPKKQINVLNVDNLVVDTKKVKADMFGGYSTEEDGNLRTINRHFDPLFIKKPKEINVHFQAVHLSIEDPKTIKLDASKAYPQTFEYAGSTISIDKVEAGQTANVVISNHEVKNRAYEQLQFDVAGDEINSSEMDFSEEVLVDKNGIEYDMNEIPFAYEKIEQPRYFVTVQTIKLQNEDTGQKVIPKTLQIHGYNTTKYLDDVVKLSLK